MIIVFNYLKSREKFMWVVLNIQQQQSHAATREGLVVDATVAPAILDII